MCGYIGFSIAPIIIPVLPGPELFYFVQEFVQANIKEIIKNPQHWPLFGEFTSRLSQYWAFPCHGAIME